jgi:tetratricopeptide (TPR) repeat protein
MTRRQQDEGGGGIGTEPAGGVGAPRPAVGVAAFAARVLALTAAVWMTTSCAAQAMGDPYPVGADAAPGADMRASERPGPVDRDTIRRLLAEAEAAYQAERWTQALESFKAVTAFDADNAQAWLRIGNLHHRRGQLLAAAGAYRKAAGDARPEQRAKALVNLASVNLELATAALDDAQALADGQAMPVVTATARDGVAVDVARQRRRLDRLASPRERSEATVDPGTVAPAGASRAARAAGLPSPGVRPAIEYVRGAPRP